MTTVAQLQNRVALVTGAGRGIGRAIAEALATEGAAVALAARSASELGEVAAAIASRGGRAHPFAVDLFERAATLELPRKVRDALGPIDILVNNAGIGSSASPGPVTEMNVEYWDKTLELNLTVPMLLSKAVLPEMLRRRWGRIIMVASIAGKVGTFHGAAYSASKHGVLGLMRSLALEVCKDGITINSICPGPVKTVMNDRRIEYDAQRLGVDLAEYEKRLTPIGGRLVPEDISPLAVYLASDSARMVTGQAFNVCGGCVMSS
jgi:NAD(P)-dependent dehydrogenase (short-subunit alcohol dehydrogenase family)